MKNEKRWKKDKKRREELLKAKHLKEQQRDVLTQTDKTIGINHLLIMIGMVVVVLSFIFFKM